MSTPPDRLPPGYHDVWHGVTRAAAHAASRAELARQLAVSTHTLQRILVDGDVPDFREAQSRRLTLSWVRTLANLAHRLGADPHGWITSVGIDWDAQVAGAAERSYRQARGGEREAAATAGTLAGIRDRARRGDPEPITAAFVDRAFFTDSLPGHAGSFFQAVVDRLVGSVHPGWGVRWRAGSPDDIVTRLTDAVGEVQLAIGLFESTRLRERGLEFLRLPGWRLPFRALWVGCADASPPSWSDLSTSGARRTGPRLLVRQDDPGESIVQQWDIPPERLDVRDGPNAVVLAGELSAAARGEIREDEAGGAVLVADAGTIGRAVETLRSIPGFEVRHRLAVLQAEHPPRYPLTIAVPAGDREWLTLLEHAWRDEMMGALRAETALLYADLTAMAAASKAAGPLAAGSMVVQYAPEQPDTALPVPEHFDGALPVFAEIFARRLLTIIARDSAPAEGVDNTWRSALRIAHTLVPAEWRPCLEGEAAALRRAAAEKAGETPPELHRYCQSCSTSLLESPGRSEEYCRYCSDDEGRLRPRDEVQRLIAEWMRGWQDGLQEEESFERAARFMSTMPAWSGN